MPRSFITDPSNGAHATALIGTVSPAKQSNGLASEDKHETISNQPYLMNINQNPSPQIKGKNVTNTFQ